MYRETRMLRRILTGRDPAVGVAGTVASGVATRDDVGTVPRARAIPGAAGTADAVVRERTMSHESGMALQTQTTLGAGFPTRRVMSPHQVRGEGRTGRKSARAAVLPPVGCSVRCSGRMGGPMTAIALIVSWLKGPVEERREKVRWICGVSEVGGSGGSGGFGCYRLSWLSGIQGREAVETPRGRSHQPMPSAYPQHIDPRCSRSSRVGVEFGCCHKKRRSRAQSSAALRSDSWGS